MAETATSPAQKASTTDATASAGKAKTQTVKPEKPNEEEYKKNLAQAEKDHAAAQEKLNAIKKKLDLTRPNNKESPNAKRQQELKSELSSIRQQQQGNKASRGAVHDKIKKLDEHLKSRLNELKTAKSRVKFRSADEVDREIERLQKQVDAGGMKIVDEKRNLSEISSLRIQRKNFATFDSQQKAIDELKEQIAEQKKLLDDPEQKALSEKYTVLQKELDGLKGEQDEAFKNLNALRDERTKLHAEQQEKYTAMKKLKDEYFDAKRAYADYEHQAYRARKERQKAERDAYEANKRKAIAREKLEEASFPAFQEEIKRAETLLRYFDPSYTSGVQTEEKVITYANEQRTIDEAGLKGKRLVRKDIDEEAYFVGGAGKKGKKGGRKGTSSPAPAAAAPTEGKFNLSHGVLEQLMELDVQAPTSQSDVPSVVEKLKEKLAKWKEDQERKTKENIAKAQAEIDRLESEAASEIDVRSKDFAKKPSQANAGVNGKVSAEAELAQEKDAEADVAEELQKAKIEDAEA